MFVILLQLIVISFICYHYYCYLNSYFLYFSLLLIPLLKLLLLLLLLLLYQYYLFLLNLLSLSICSCYSHQLTEWPEIFFKNIKYNSRTIQGFFNYIFGMQYSHTPQNMMIDKHI